MTDRVAVYKGADRLVTLRRDATTGLALRVKLRPGRNTEAMLRKSAQAFGAEATSLARGELVLMPILENAPNLERLRASGNLTFEEAPTGARAKRKAEAEARGPGPASESVGEILARAEAEAAAKKAGAPAPPALRDAVTGEVVAWTDKSKRDDLTHAMASRGLPVPEGYTRAQMIDDLRAWDELQAEADRPAERDAGPSEADRPADVREAEANRAAAIEESRTTDRLPPPTEGRPPRDVIG